MSPRTGRPTNNPKTMRLEVRLSDGDVEKLNYCCKVLGLTKSEVIRQGIEKMYQMAKNRTLPPSQSTTS